jgi:class 3 adenylate cyclase/outer membrane protein OmpA-like peptidoglycan-associated protein
MDLTGRERVKRRLAAILAADVVGYSRLMGEDEEGTLAELKAVRQEVTDPAIKEHRGRIVKTMGDGLLVEFASVVDAVLCAIEVQRKMRVRNQEIPADRRMVFRVGINLGDIIIDQDDIFGDGVNVAARLETLAEPGGICISQVVRDQVHGKLDVAFVDQGERQFKNIAQPVRAFRIWLTDKPPPRAPLLFPEKPSTVASPFPSPAKPRFDQSYFHLVSQQILNHRSLFTTIIFIAVSASVVSLSMDLRIKFGEKNHFNGTSQSSGSPSGTHSSGILTPDGPRSQPAENRSSAAGPAARSSVIGDAVFFEKDKVVLPASANATVDRQAEFLKANPTITVTVEGYCSEDEGAREGPAALAQLRANQVRNALKARGVAGTRIHTVGYGKPMAETAGADETPQPKNRRAVVIRD